MPGACQNLEKIIGPLELGVPNGFKPLCSCWESKQGYLKEELVLLIDKLSLQPFHPIFLQDKVLPLSLG